MQIKSKPQDSITQTVLEITVVLLSLNNGDRTSVSQAEKKETQADSSFLLLKWISRTLQGRQQPSGNAHAFHVGVALRKSSLHSWYPGQTKADSCSISHTGERGWQASSFIPKSSSEKLCYIQSSCMFLVIKENKCSLQTHYIF